MNPAAETRPYTLQQIQELAEKYFNSDDDMTREQLARTILTFFFGEGGWQGIGSDYQRA